MYEDEKPKDEGKFATVIWWVIMILVGAGLLYVTVSHFTSPTPVGEVNKPNTVTSLPVEPVPKGQTQPANKPPLEDRLLQKYTPPDDERVKYVRKPVGPGQTVSIPMDQQRPYKTYVDGRCEIQLVLKDIEKAVSSTAEWEEDGPHIELYNPPTQQRATLAINVRVAAGCPAVNFTVEYTDVD